MPDTTDWYERGCSRGCRNKHTLVWGWCDLAEEPKPELNLHVFETFTASDGNTSGKFRQVTAEEARAELAKFEPEPTWADVREAARNAGWRMVRDRSTVQKCWSIRNPDEDGWFIDKGWAVATFDPNTNRGRWLFEFAGPGPHRKPTATLVDPTPAEVLAAARLVGLGGGDER